MRNSPLFVLLLLCVFATPARAEAELRVGVKPAPPFVMVEGDGEPTGFSVDLMREILRRMDPELQYRFVVFPDLPTHLKAVSSGDVDLGIAATSVTAERERMVDFSNPYFQDALDIAVHGETERSLLDALWASDVPGVMLALLVFVLVMAHLVWLFERKRGDFSPQYGKGVLEGIWWTIVTMSTVGYGDYAPKTTRGRGLGVLVIFVGIAVFGIAVASLTAAATAQQLASPIQGPGDLHGLRVATLPDSTAKRTLSRRGIATRTVESTIEGLEAVRDGRLDAFVHDRSQLLYALSQGEDRFEEQVAVVGRPFFEQSYAVTFPIDSDLRKEVNIALRELQESDAERYQKLRDLYFPGP